MRRPGAVLTALLAAGLLVMGACTSTRPEPAGTTTASPATSTSIGCQSGQVRMSWMPGQPPPGPVCVHVGTPLSISLYPPDLHLWTTPASSNPQIAEVVAPGVSQEGVMSFTVRAVKPGRTVLASVAQARDGAPDPHDVPWQLTVTVIS